jgi:hypothetical protein
MPQAMTCSGDQASLPLAQSWMLRSAESRFTSRTSKRHTAPAPRAVRKAPPGHATRAPKPRGGARSGRLT